MIQLTLGEHEALRAVIQAGPKGLLLTGRDVALSTAIRLEQAGLTTVHEGHRLTVTATNAGKAFAWRTAA